MFISRWHQVRGQHGPSLGVFHGDEAVPHRWMRFDDGLDLAELDAEATNLDLLVGSADEFQVARDVAADQVSGSIQPHAGIERVGDESLRGQPGTTEIPTRQLNATEVQLTDDLRGHRLQLLVEHVGVDVAVRHADRHYARALRPRDPLVCRAHDGLGRAIVIA